MGVVEKSGCVWSDIFKNQNKLSIFIRFILKENGFSTKKWGQSAKITDFHDFAVKIGRGRKSGRALS